MPNLIKYTIMLFLFLTPLTHAHGQEPKKDTVVIIHGIGQYAWNMAGVEFSLKKQGYKTLNISYPSLKKNIDSLSDVIHDELKRKGVWESASPKIHFTTHSMGGLVLKAYLNKYKKEIPLKKLGQVVMLAPPHGGSDIADLLLNFLPYKWIYGPAGQELTTKAQIQNQAKIYYNLGIIAGNKEWPYIIAAHILPNESDGRVALEKTKIMGMKDHITLSATHSFIAWKPSIHKQIIYFIKNMKFNPEK